MLALIVTMADAPYHHGNLREALLREAEAELDEKGVEGFSLRGVAKRAGVSHAAPAHHFGDAAGLLTALATRGFELFLEAKRARRDLAPADAAERMVANGLGYVDFALARPALFRLIFACERVRHEDPALKAAAGAAYGALREGIADLAGADPEADEAARLDLLSAWATAHGLADLLSSGQLPSLAAAPRAQREATLAAALRRAIGGDRTGASARSEAAPDEAV
ncbi:MAG: TetR/AcrR family transcriptional regulator [Pseudomonadota bacterium]